MMYRDRRAVTPVFSRRLVSLFLALVSFGIPKYGDAKESFRFFVPMSTPAPGNPGVTCEATIELMGLLDGTTYELYALNDVGVDPLVTGVVDRFETVALSSTRLLSNRAYRVETSHMVLAYMGEDCLGQGIGGSFFYPTSNGRSFIGKRYDVNIPILSDSNQYVIFAYEDADVSIKQQNGTTVASTTMLENSYWEPVGLKPRTVYQVESSGRIAMQSNASSGYTDVPGEYVTNATSCYNNAATRFLFATPGGNPGNLLLVFAHEDAKVVLKDLTAPQDKGVNADLLAGETWTHRIGGATPGYWLLETDNKGRVSVRVGMETKESPGGSYFGEDISFSAGLDSYEFHLHADFERGHLFLFNDDTTVDLIDDAAQKTTYTFDSNEYLSPESGEWFMEAGLPATLEVIGGVPKDTDYELINFGSFVPPSFVFDVDDNDIGDHEEDKDKDGNPDACDLDDDGDGIPDDRDGCPTVAPEAGDDPDSDGCPGVTGDADGDGINDNDDLCPDRPEDIDGDADDDGCPETDDDADGDGIADEDDPCPDTPEDFDGVNDDDGCPETDGDSDGDGIDDDEDNCVDTYNPSQADADNDGIGDACEDDEAGNLPQVGATGTGFVFSCSASVPAARSVRAETAGGLLEMIWSLLP